MNFTIHMLGFSMIFMLLVGGPLATRLWRPFFHIPYRISFLEDIILFCFCFIKIIKWTKTFPIEEIYHIRFGSYTNKIKTYDQVSIYMDRFGLRIYQLNDEESNWDHTSIEKFLSIAGNYCNVIKVRNNL